MTWAKAIFWKNIDEFKSLIAAGDKLNDVIAPNGYTPLIYAARMGHPEMVRMLIQAGANPNARTERNESVIAMVRLSDAPSAVKDEIIRMLVGAGAPPEPLPVPEISLVEQVSLEREALRRKEQIKNEYPREKSLVERIEAAALVGHNLGDFLREAEIAENATALRLLFDHGVGVKSILTAFPLNKGNELAVQHFLLHGADVNSRGALERTPLFNVREPEILDFLLKAGAEVNVQDEFGQTPLMNAETREITRRLIAAGATINAIDEEGCTALMRIGGKRGIDLLIEAGADLNARDLIGKTALIHHCQNGDINSVRELIKANASLNIKDRLGKSAMQYAKLAGYSDLVQLLRQAGAGSSGLFRDSLVTHWKILSKIAGIAIVSLVLIINIVVWWQKPPIEVRTVDVGGSVLTMRAEPHIKGAFILSIPDNAEVTVVENSESEETIGRRTGKWLKVRYGDREGWVFGGFLK